MTGTTQTGPPRPVDDDPTTIGTDPGFVLPRMIERWSRCDPDRPFLIEIGTGRTESYGRFRDLTRRWARVLTDAGVSEGHRVVSLLPGSVDAHAVWIASSLIGAMEVPVNPELRGEFLRHALAQAEPSVCVVRPDQVPAVPTGLDLSLLVVPRGASPAENAEPLDIDELPSPRDVSCVIYTSGTSGPAKGVVISWAQLATTIGRIPRSWLSDADTVYSPWPMFHVTGRSPLFAMADVGGRVAVRERFSRQHFWSDIDSHGCTVTTAGTVAAILLADAPGPDDRHHCLRHVFLGTGAVGLRFVERFGVNGISCYGSTEVGFPIANPSITAATCESIGWLRPGYEARIVDGAGADVRGEEVGELLIRPPVRELVMLEYRNSPELTSDAFVDGWYRTGDAVRRLDDGTFVFVERMNETIRRFGENISAKELERAVVGVGDVVECAALGVPSEVSGSDILLCVVAPAGRLVDPAALFDRLTGWLPRYMWPTFIAVIDELPTTPNGKISKHQLAATIDLDACWSATR